MDDLWTSCRPFKVDDVQKQTMIAHERLNRDCEQHADVAHLLREGWTGTTYFITRRSTKKVSPPVTDEQLKEHPKHPQLGHLKSAGTKEDRRTQAAEDSAEFAKDLRAADKQAKWSNSTLIEVCCSKTSELSSQKYFGAHRRAVRITKDDDLRTAAGLQKALTAIRDPKAGHLTGWFALPCTWGSQARTCNKGIDAEKYLNRSIELWDEFQDLFSNAIIIA